MKIQEKQDVIIKGFEYVNLSNIRVPMIAIYNGPDDFPDKYVARLYNMNVATNIIMVEDDIEKIRENIRKNYITMVPLPKSKLDVKSLVETWF